MQVLDYLLSLCVCVLIISILLPVFGKVQYGFSLSTWSKYASEGNCDASPWTCGKAKKLQGSGKPFYRSCAFPWCHWSDLLGCWRDRNLRCASFSVLRKPVLILIEPKSKVQTLSTDTLPSAFRWEHLSYNQPWVWCWQARHRSIPLERSGPSADYGGKLARALPSEVRGLWVFSGVCSLGALSVAPCRAPETGSAQASAGSGHAAHSHGLLVFTVLSITLLGGFKFFLPPSQSKSHTHTCFSHP